MKRKVELNHEIYTATKLSIQEKFQLQHDVEFLMLEQFDSTINQYEWRRSKGVDTFQFNLYELGPALFDSYPDLNAQPYSKQLANAYVELSQEILEVLRNQFPECEVSVKYNRKGLGEPTFKLTLI